MIVLSRARALTNALQRVNCGVARQTIRKASGEWGYRTTDAKWTPLEKVMVNGLYFLTFSWMLYRGYHDFTHHVIAPKDYPNAKDYTDAELGIPPDDEDIDVE